MEKFNQLIIEVNCGFSRQFFQDGDNKSVKYLGNKARGKNNNQSLNPVIFTKVF